MGWAGLGDDGWPWGPDDVTALAINPHAPCSPSRSTIPSPHPPLIRQGAAHDDLREATEKMIVAQAQRDRLQQHLHALSPEAAAEAAAAADVLAGGDGSAGSGGDGDVVRGHLERIAELEAEVKRLKTVSRCGPRWWAGPGWASVWSSASPACLLGLA